MSNKLTVFGKTIESGTTLDFYFNREDGLIEDPSKAEIKLTFGSNEYGAPFCMAVGNPWAVFFDDNYSSFCIPADGKQCFGGPAPAKEAARLFGGRFLIEKLQPVDESDDVTHYEFVLNRGDDSNVVVHQIPHAGGWVPAYLSGDAKLPACMKQPTA